MGYRTALLFGSFWTGWRRWAGWSVCVSALLLLSVLRIETDAEFAFASFALLPVLVIAWMEGQRSGLVVALLAAAIWTVGGIVAGRQFSAPWIPWVNAITRIATYSLVAILAAQVRWHLDQEREQAAQDPLTGLENRRRFLEAGAAEVERLKRYGHPLAVIFLDLDDFKQLNDAMGHAAGDMALRATACALLGSLRSCDHVARLGGDEFAVLLPEIGYDAAVETGRKISIAVNGSLRGFPPVRGSIGVAWFRDADRLFPEMLQAADGLMYEVKANGRDAVRSRRFGSGSAPDSEAQVCVARPIGRTSRGIGEANAFYSDVFPHDPPY